METTNKMDLSQFYGTEKYWKTNIFTPQLKHTDGVQYFADTGGCFWFLDIVASEIYPLLNKEPFIGIKLIVGSNQSETDAVIVATDGNEDVIFRKLIPHTDCPVGVYEFFLTDNVLMLTSEY